MKNLQEALIKDIFEKIRSFSIPENEKNQIRMDIQEAKKNPKILKIKQDLKKVVDLPTFDQKKWAEKFATELKTEAGAVIFVVLLIGIIYRLMGVVPFVLTATLLNSLFMSLPPIIIKALTKSNDTLVTISKKLDKEVIKKPLGKVLMATNLIAIAGIIVSMLMTLTTASKHTMTTKSMLRVAGSSKLFIFIIFLTSIGAAIYKTYLGYRKYSPKEHEKFVLSQEDFAFLKTSILLFEYTMIGTGKEKEFKFHKPPKKSAIEIELEDSYKKERINVSNAQRKFNENPNDPKIKEMYTKAGIKFNEAKSRYKAYKTTGYDPGGGSRYSSASSSVPLSKEERIWKAFLQFRITNQFRKVWGAERLAKFLSTTPKTSGILILTSGAILASMLIYSSYKLHDKFFSEFSNQCSSFTGKEKTICIKKFEIKSLLERIDDLKKGRAYCSKSKDPKICDHAINVRINELTEELKEKIREKQEYES